MADEIDRIEEKFGGLTATQKQGLSTLLAATQGLPVEHRAYILATAWHETGPIGTRLHMMPRREIWGPTGAQRRYENNRALGNTQPGDGKRYMGRGYVQITGRGNYKKASDVIGVDLVANPDAAMQPQIAAKIIVDGMTRGWFTGRKLADYSSYSEMRRVVNGRDKAALIASYANKFEEALWGEQPKIRPGKKPNRAIKTGSLAFLSGASAGAVGMFAGFDWQALLVLLAFLSFWLAVFAYVYRRELPDMLGLDK
jgi:hypothetical protein